MSMILRCGKVVPGCAVVLHGKSEDDVLLATVDHLKTAHGLGHISVDLRQRLKAAIEPEETPRRVASAS